MSRFCAVVFLLFVSFHSIGQTVRPSQPDLVGDIMLDYGFNFWSQDAERLRLDPWRSNSFSVYYNRMFKISDRLTFNPAVGLGFERYAFNDDFTWITDNEGSISLDTLSGVSLLKNKLQMTYLDVPAEIRFYPWKTVNGEGLFVGVGVIAGLRINTVAKIRYPNGTGGQVKNKLNQRLGVNDYRYGAQVRLGWRTFHVYFKYYLSEVFDGSPDGSGVSPTAVTFGLNLSGF